MSKNDDGVRDPFLDDEELQATPTKRRGKPQNMAEREQAFYNSPDDELYQTYGIRPNLPLRTKVESLHLIYRLDVNTIATLLRLSNGTVHDEIEALTDEWKRMGRPLTPDERELQRGRYIAELDRTIQQIDDSMVGGGDSKSLSLKMNALEKRAKLLGLELDKRDRAVDEEEAETTLLEEVDSIINKLRPEDLSAMMAVLDDQSSSSSSGLPSPGGTAKPAGNSAIELTVSEPDAWGLD